MESFQTSNNIQGANISTLDKSKTHSPLLSHSQQKQDIASSPLLQHQQQFIQQQDTNYIGITINDDIPKHNNSNDNFNVSRHQSLSNHNYTTITPNQISSPSSSMKTTHNNNHSRHASISFTPNNNTSSSSSPNAVHNTSITSSRTNSLPNSMYPSSRPLSLYANNNNTTSNRYNNGYNTMMIEESDSDSYMIQPELSGAFRKIKSQVDLPMAPHRRAREGKRYGPLYMLTSELKVTYQACNHGFQYNATNNPRRVLTKPSKAARNDGVDNDDFDYILYVNDALGSTEGHKYVILDLLGSGTFGQVVKCRNTKTQEIVAVKVVKNKMAYFKQSMMEVAILEMLNQRYDEHDSHHLLRLRDTFIHKKHLCLVFELLSVNLYELIKQNHFRGLSTNLVRVFVAQILDALTILNEARIVHCDLKPENILLKNLESPTIKIIDFGSACHEVQTMYTYIQSRFYRSPEVLLGLPYTSAIDMWSLGCIAAELFLGLPLFPGSSEYNQLSRIVEMLGQPPNYMIEVGKNASRYFDREDMTSREKKYEFKPLEKYAQEQQKQEQPSKRYFSSKTLPDLINSYPIMRKMQLTPKEIEKEKQNRLAFIDFLQGLLNLNPIERWSPQQAKKHPFITGEKFTCAFQPPFIPRKQHHVIPSNSNSTSTTSGSHGIRNSMDLSLGKLSYQHRQSFSLSDNHNNTTGGKRSSYIPPLPSVMEPTSHNFQSLLDTNSNNNSPSLIHHQLPLHHSTASTLPSAVQQPHLQQTLGIPQNNSRPRANTLGTMQVPSQIQWATVDHPNPAPITEGSLYSPYYPYEHHPHPPPPQQVQQHSNGNGNVNSNRSLSQDDSGILLPLWKSSNSSNQTIDLERDGDCWQDETQDILPISSTSTSTHNQQQQHHQLRHRRSNSSSFTRYADIPSNNGLLMMGGLGSGDTGNGNGSGGSSGGSGSTSHGRSSGGVASLHRFMRGHTLLNHNRREDLEWDGVVQLPSYQYQQSQQYSQQKQQQQQYSQQQHEDLDDKSSKEGDANGNSHKWKNDHTGWMIA